MVVRALDFALQLFTSTAVCFLSRCLSTVVHYAWTSGHVSKYVHAHVLVCLAHQTLLRASADGMADG